MRPPSTTSTRSNDSTDFEPVGHDDELFVELGEVAFDERVLRASSSVVGSSATIDGGLDHEHRGEGEQLLLPARQPVRRAVGELGEPEAIECAVDAGRGIRCIQPKAAQREGDIFAHRRHDDLVVGIREHESDRRRTSRPLRATSSPSTITRPAVGVTRPLTMRASVDLPEPFAPMTPIRRSVRRSDTSAAPARRRSGG